MEGRPGRLKEKLISVNRVSHTRAGGRIGRYQAFLVVGDQNGTIGYAKYTAHTLKKAREGAYKRACSKVLKIPLIDGGCPFDFTINARGLRMKFSSYKSIGRLVANPMIASIMELAGMRYGMVKMYAMPSIMRTVRMFLERLSSTRPSKAITWGRNLPGFLVE